MKRLFTLITLMVAFTAAWADSPLTSTYFAEAYSEHPMIQLVGEGMQGELPTTLLNFLADKHAPVDVRLAVINKLGWNFDGTNFGNELGQYLMSRYGVKNEKKLANKLDARTLAVYAYAKAMSNYFDVKDASNLAHKAVKKNKDKSLSVALIASLIDAQIYLDSDWSKIYPVVNNVLHDGSLHLDMRQEAIDAIMEYIGLYSEYN